MLRLAPNGYYRLFQNDQMQATFGGGEANVAVSLANYGFDSVFVTKLPKNSIGQAAIESVFTILKKALLNEAQFVYMIVNIQPFKLLMQTILIGILFSMV